MAERKSSSTTGVPAGTEAGAGSASAGSSSGSAGTRRSTAGTTEGQRPSTTGTSAGTEHDAGSIVGRVRERAAAQINTQKDRATDGLGGVAQAVRQSTQQLRDQQHETVAGYVEQAADQIERLSRRLKEKDVGELVQDAQRLARRQPALFVGSAFALGLVGARFFKSSSTRDEDRYGAYGYDDYGGSQYPGRYTGGSYGGSEYERSLPASGTGTTPGSRSVGGTGYRSPDTEKF
jgi:hypothetical protein